MVARADGEKCRTATGERVLGGPAAAAAQLCIYGVIFAHLSYRARASTPVDDRHRGLGAQLLSTQLPAREHGPCSRVRPYVAGQISPGTGDNV